MESDPNVTLLTIATQKITLYCPLIIIIIGTVGCLGNFLTFTSIKLRKNSCSFYFLCATVFDLLTLDFGALTRLLADHFGVMLYHQVRVYCQIRQYLVTSLPALATLFIVLAAMDRFMSTSSRQVYRSFATIRNARWIGFVSMLICLLCYIHYPMYSDLRPMCSLQGGSYGVFTVVFSIIWTSFAPHFLMLVFGFGTYRHISWTRRRVLPANNQQRRIERTEKQLITMMLFQVGISSLLILTRIAYFSYNIIGSAERRTLYQRALDTFFSQLTTQLFYLNYAKSFYLYTLSSPHFRRIFIESLFKLYHSIVPGPDPVPLRTRPMNLHQRENESGTTRRALRSTDPE